MPYAAPIDTLADFQQQLVGTWQNQPFAKDCDGKPLGGRDNPLPHNIMPLPQAADADGYILKNFKYHERLKFNDDKAEDTLAIAAEAPNRGGLVAQSPRALFYEQQVRFSEGPAVGEVVHVENGAWLALPRFVQQAGPYPADINVEPVSAALRQPADTSIAKQITVPHGNSVLAIGGVDTNVDARGEEPGEKSPVIAGVPVIPDAPFPYPMPSTAQANAAAAPTLVSNLNATRRYSGQRSRPDDFQNPHPDLTQSPNKPLQQAVAVIEPDAYMHWHVTTQPRANGRGHVTDIPFEMRVSDVAEYWLMFKDKNKYLAYTQTILWF